MLIENNVASALRAIEALGQDDQGDDGESGDKEVGYWMDFMKKWGYDSEQQMMIKAALETIET